MNAKETCFTSIAKTGDQYQCKTVMRNGISHAALYSESKKAVIGFTEKEPFNPAGGHSAIKTICEGSPALVPNSVIYCFPVSDFDENVVRMGAKPLYTIYETDETVSRTAMVVVSRVTDTIVALATNLKQLQEKIDRLEQEQSRTDLFGVTHMEFLQLAFENVEDIIGCSYSELLERKAV